MERILPAAQRVHFRDRPDLYGAQWVREDSL